MKYILEAQVMNKFRSKRPLGFYNLIKGHTGVDLLYVFEPYPSPISGTVVDCNFYGGGPGDKMQNEMGNTIYIQAQEDGSIHVFSHFSRVDVKKGQKVILGDVLGITGNSGIKSTRAHLHGEIIIIGKPKTLENRIMSRSLNGYVGYNVDPLNYYHALYSKYQRNIKGLPNG